MSKSRKKLILLFLVLGVILIIVSFSTNHLCSPVLHTCYVLAAGALICVILALVLLMYNPNC